MTEDPKTTLADSSSKPVAATATTPMPTTPMCCASVPEIGPAADTVTVRPCGIVVEPGRLMCDAHWAMVSGEVRRALVKQQRRSPGAPRSAAWRELAKEAVLEVWKAQVRKLEDAARAAIAAKAAGSGSVAADAPPEAPAEEAPQRPPDAADR